MTMDNFNIFGLQVALTFVAFFLICKYYIWPKVSRMPGNDGLKALVATNIFRHLGLVFLVTPQVVAANVPHSWTEPVAFGDLITVILAIAAFLGLASRQSWAPAVTWLFNIVGLVDLLMAFGLGIPAHAWEFNTGSAWYITTFVAPVFMTIHVMIFKLLLSRKGSSARVSNR
jgi:hypothetical protein